MRTGLALLTAFAAGVLGCGAAAPSVGSARPSAPVDGERIESVDGVDLADLTDVERETWTDLVNTLLSPCGQPESVARCAVADSCRSCRVAARYVRRLVLDGHDRETIETHFEGRFGPEGASILALDHVPMRGADGARVTVVEFSDFQCPYCGQAHPMMARLLARHAGKLRVGFKHFPLLIHPRAVPAARAAEAARLQGRFWEMHDVLFEHQHALEDADIERYAAQLGLVLEKFRVDLASPEVQARIDADRAEGAMLRLEGTPTLFIQGRRFRESLDALDAYIEEEMDRDDHH